MLQSYLPLVGLLILASVVAGGLLLVSWLLPLLFKVPRTTPNKLSTYECGTQPVGSARERFNVKFYMVAMLFILFDIEVVFLYPWAVIYKDFIAMGPETAFILWEVVIFAVVLMVGLVYIWRTDALRWD